ncbi:hypothetical protein AXF42_Ash002614 [Apostasia shenzhenica]|uniref:Uncharacterized protein n=1 Tax=Apostasia shenzhenica TaxID=1088818 RepID=A0A2I0AP27_9ASPA|nr:hypothetical protein AXF42_Ash002614 [Apostasia shenzhenica]
MVAPASRNYRTPKVNDYDRLIDPRSMLSTSERLTMGDPVLNAYKCYLFCNTLIGLALD